MELKDSMTIFIIPFSFGNCKTDSLALNSCKWEHHPLNIDKGAIYPHIHNFLVENFHNGDQLMQQKCIVYSLKDSWEDINDEDRPISKLIRSHTNVITIKQNEENKDLKFRFLNTKNNLSSPKLILYPQALIGLLIFSIELISESPTIGDLISLNYNLAKIDPVQSPKILISNSSSHTELNIEISNINTALAKYSTITKNDLSGWYLNGFIKFLLSDFDINGSCVNILNEARTHLFTYIQVDSKEVTEDLKRDFILITRCQNEKYKLTHEDFDLDKNFKQLFDNIFIASCVEGAALMTLAHDDSPTHIKNFKTGTLIPRYLWIYLLVYIQRQSIIEVNKELLEIDLETAYDSKNNLRTIVSRLSKMKINAYFTDISDHTQHNTFYHFCARNLSIKEHLNEANDKIKDLEAILQEQIEESDKERSKSWKNILGRLMIPSIYFAFLSFIGFKITFDCEQITKSIISGTLILIALGCIYPVLKLILIIRKESKKDKHIKK